jgi:hypothetical protein
LYTHPEDFYIDPEAESEALDDESDKDPEEQPEEHTLVDFEAFARRRPQEDFTHVDLFDSLGSREMDHNYD